MNLVKMGMVLKMETLKRFFGPKVANSFHDLKPNRYIEVSEKGWAYVSISGLFYRSRESSVFVLYPAEDTTLYPFQYKVLPPDHAQVLFFDLFFQHVMSDASRHIQN